jgi:uncharacterized protein (TIGR02246 family)
MQVMIDLKPEARGRPPKQPIRDRGGWIEARRGAPVDPAHRFTHSTGQLRGDSMIRRITQSWAAVAGGVLLLAVFFVLPRPTAPAARGADQTGEPDRADDQAAVRKRTEALIQALAKGDAREVAAFWTATGEYMRGDELSIRGRSNIEKAYAEHFKTRKPGVIELQSESVRFLSDDTAVQEGSFLVKRPNPADETRSRFSALFVREKGQWSFALLREWPEGPSLQELGWLVGTWTSKSEGAEVRATFEWTEDKTFLRGRFSMKVEGHTVSGFQILAIDPATKSIKSWTFEGDGGLGEAVWTRGDKGWSAKTTGVTAEGEKVVATTTLTPTDDNSFTWKSTGRTVDGEKVPDVGPVKVVRETTK